MRHTPDVRDELLNGILASARLFDQGDHPGKVAGAITDAGCESLNGILCPRTGGSARQPGQPASVMVAKENESEAAN